MSPVFFVDDASEKARWLIRQESRGPGDTRNAMERLARRHGIPFGVLWTLRYRKPKDLMISAYAAICDARDKEIERVGGLLDEERTKTTPTTLVGRAMARAAAAVGGAQGASVEGAEE